MTQKTTVNRLAALTVSLLMLFAAILPMAANAQGGPPADVAERVAERRQAAMQKVEEKRQRGQEKSQQARQAACERRVGALENVMDRRSEVAVRLVGTFDSIYERVQGFYESGQLTDPNYDELKANVDEAQAAAQLEAEATADLNVEVDCEDPDVAATVGAFRDSMVAARTALQEYRSALVELISSLRAVAAEDNAQNDDSADESENETEDETEEEDETENETENEEES